MRMEGQVGMVGRSRVGIEIGMVGMERRGLQ